MKIHHTAIIHDGAVIGDDCIIGPYCVIGERVILGRSNIVNSHVVISGRTTVGDNNKFYSFATIGNDPQDYTYKGEDTRLIIGDNNTFREGTNISTGTLKEKGETIIGSNSLFMHNVHVGHDSVVGSNCTFVNGVMLAGHVKVGDFVIIGGGTGVSQFVHIYTGAYIGGASALDKDLPSYFIGYGNRFKVKGINIIGMKRRGVPKKVITETIDFHRDMELSGLSPRSFVEKIKDPPNGIIADIIQQILDSEIGIALFV